MSNRGIYPPDAATDVGKVRYLVGDVVATDVSAGEGSYASYSDLDIEQFLVAAVDNTQRAAGYALMQAATAASLASRTIKDYDLQVDLTKRAADLRATAQMYFDRADAADDLSDDSFVITSTGTRCECPAEFAGHYVGCPFWL